MRHKADHQHKTTGRKPDAERTITTRNSDVGEAKRTRAIRASEAEHKQTMMLKWNVEEISTKALAEFAMKKLKRKQKIPSRPNAWQKGRKLKSRGFR